MCTHTFSSLSQAYIQAQHSEFIHNPVFHSKTSTLGLKACTYVGVMYKKGLFVYVCATMVLSAFMGEVQFVASIKTQKQIDTWEK